jgi:hypothetical protein
VHRLKGKWRLGRSDDCNFYVLTPAARRKTLNDMLMESERLVNPWMLSEIMRIKT